LYVPDGSPVNVTLVPDPGVVILPGLLVRVQDSVGRPLKLTLPVATEQVGFVIIPTTGSLGIALIDNVNVVRTAIHGPEGLSVTTVIVIIFPISELFGVYVNENGDFVEDDGLTEPAPFSVIVIFVALPPNVFPANVNAAVPHELPSVLLRVITGVFVHWPDSSTLTRKVKKSKHKILTIYSIVFY
jgi:hypothetical protein